jgi:hypothetical protein
MITACFVDPPVKPVIYRVCQVDLCYTFYSKMFDQFLYVGAFDIIHLIAFFLKKISVEFHRGAVEDDLFFVEMKLGEKQPFLNNHNGPPGKQRRM